MKELKRINNVYLSGKPKYNFVRASSQLDSIKKSVSIVSISPSENMHMPGKDSLNYNPYSKNARHPKIHLPYLKKQSKRVYQNGVFKESNGSNRRNERIASKHWFSILLAGLTKPVYYS